MNIGRKKILALVLCLAITVSAVYASSQIFWSKTLTHTITIHGITADLLNATFEGYDQKQVALDLSSDNTVALTIYAENFYFLWLNWTWTSPAPGLTVTMNGTYYLAYRENIYSSGTYNRFLPNATSPVLINIPTNTSYVVDKTQMMYTVLTIPPFNSGDTGTIGHCLVLTFDFQAELGTLPGSYPLNLRVDMGHT
jgi:hypothetical protein